MKAGIYDPYLDTLGGGERYCLTLAEMLLDLGWQVDLFWEGEDIKKRITSRLGFRTERVNFIANPKNLIEKLLVHPHYDLLFYLSDGSIPWMFGKKNLLHLQVPFTNLRGRSFSNRLKFLLIKKVIYNSRFTKKIADLEYGIKGEVIYPPVEVNKFKPKEKENLIISVGRFSQLLQAKSQDVLIEAFRKLYASGLKNWRLVLAGGSEVGGEAYVKKIKKMVQDYPIDIKENISFSQLTELYSRAKFFWGASGYGIDEVKNPQKVEHFGITAVEAMAAGAIPLLVKKGGFREVIEEGKSGYFWEEIEDLLRITQSLIKTDLKDFQKEVRKRSKLFSKEVFNEKFRKIIF